MTKANEIEVHDYEIVPPDGVVVDLGDVPVEQLRKALAKADAKAKKTQERKRKKYEEQRNEKVCELAWEAFLLHEKLKIFKQKVHDTMEDQSVKLAEYGEIRSNSKGGFQLKSDQNDYRIRRTRDTQPTWDERSNKAVELIKEFLQDAVKKRAEKEFNLIMSFLEKNQAGDLEYQKVMMLLSNQDNYDDPRWKEGLRLLRESYKVVLKGFGYYFDSKNADDKWEAVSLNFSSITL